METGFEGFTVLLSRISRNIRKLKTEQMESLDLKAPHVSCLYYLHEFGPQTAAELCERCEEDKAAISRSLDYLERNGYLVREVTGKKSYRSLLRLTDKGMQTAGEMARRISHIVEAASGELTPEERQTMYRALEIICRNLENLNHKEIN